MDWSRCATIDFETLPIGPRPNPPKPVGVAIKIGGAPGKYYGWAHPHGNNSCSMHDAMGALHRAVSISSTLLFHNAKFDVDVMETHCGIQRYLWDRYHDTLPMLFLQDPHAPSFGLKDSAVRILKRKASERDEIVDWLVARQPVPGIKLSVSQSSDHYAGAYVAWAPVSLVARYAVGDVDRTYALATRVYKYLERRKMIRAYDRERRLMLVLLDMERRGVCVDLDRMSADLPRHERELVEVDTALRQRLQCGESANLDSGKQLAEILLSAGVATEESLGYTATGKVATNKKALAGGIEDQSVLAALTYRTNLTAALQTFLRPWHAAASTNGGWIYTEWHSTRREHGSGGVGARTGRLTSTPNFQNLSRTPAVFAGWPALPNIRSYVLPMHPNHVLIDRDYSSQEPRILAHFEDGDLLRAYKTNPWIDYHDRVREVLAAHGVVLERNKVKPINLGLIYGMGVGKMAEVTGLSVDETKQIKRIILSAYPGLQDLYAEARARARENKPMRTWGGREYYCEPSRIINGRAVDFDYKLPNYLIQGSASDCMKEALIRYVGNKPKNHELAFSVHDQIVASVPRGDLHDGMRVLRESMESVEFDVPLLSEGKYGDNWGELRVFDAKGVARCETV